MKKRPPANKTAQLREEYRKYQKRLAFWQPIPSFFHSFVVGVFLTRKIFPSYNVATVVALVFGVLSLASMRYIQYLENNRTVIRFSEMSLKPGGVCPDCRVPLEFTIDKHKLKVKNFVAHLVSWVFPFGPLIYLAFLFKYDPKGDSTAIFLLPFLLIFFLPILTAIDNINKPRTIFCGKCGFSDSIGLDPSDTKRTLAVRFIELFWLPLFRYKWLIVVVAIVSVLLLVFESLGFLALVFFWSVPIGIMVFYVGSCNYDFYKSYFDLPKKEPKEKSAA